jgi:DNA-binding NarL/FixJ family response regulator
MNKKYDEAYNVIVVEDEPVYAIRFCEAITNTVGLNLAGSFTQANSAIAWLKNNKPDVLLCDIGLPDLPGIAVIKYCAQHYPDTDIMVISMFEDEAHVIHALEAGATGYLLKDSLTNEIPPKIFELVHGGAPMSPVIARLVLKRFHVNTSTNNRSSTSESNLIPILTPKEQLVLNRIAQGFKYLEIALQEGISVNTVATHVRHIYEKLAVNSRSEAVFEAQQLGLLDLGIRHT